MIESPSIKANLFDRLDGLLDILIIRNANTWIH